ncbi:BCCT family transporter [Roseobacteraceae bacterium S113]
MVDISGNVTSQSSVRSTALQEVLKIHTTQHGAYEGFNLVVAATSKIFVLLLVGFLVMMPEASAAGLNWMTALTLRLFADWYNAVLTVFVIFAAIVVCLPISGRLRLGPDDVKPDYSTTSWMCMMFCAGIGGGILAFSVSEPISHFMTNPDLVAGDVRPNSYEAAISALKHVYLHWGLSAWACYAVVGLVLGLACHRYGQPLTMRSGLAPIFGKRLEGALGNAIDMVAILAIISGITTTIALGIEQICSGISEITGSAFFASNSGDPTLIGLLTALVVAISVAVTSVLSGVNRGVKWISQLGMFLAIGILVLFVISGAGLQTFGLFFDGTVAYLKMLPEQLHLADPAQSETSALQRDWQNEWTIFYWAWWIAFAPFVGLFLARISRGRTVREFILGAILAPTSLCFVWFAGTGGSALLLELDGSAGGLVLSAEHAFRIYETMDLLLTPSIAIVLKAALVLLFLLLVVASTTAAIMAIKSIGCAGVETSETRMHSVVWACVIAAFAAAILLIGGVDAVRDMMIISALPFSVILLLNVGSAAWIIHHARREEQH